MTTPSLPAFSVLLNNLNLVSGRTATFEAVFSEPITLQTGNVIALTSASIPYSWYNISASANNNTFRFKWPAAADYATITIPDGNYSLQSLNEYIQFYCINNGMYLINGSSNVYYINLSYNSTYNKAQLLLYEVPISLPSGYTQPSNFAGYPATVTTPGVQVLSNQFANIIGFAPGIYGNNATSLSIMSDSVPQPFPIKSVVINDCNLVSDSNDSSVVASIPINAPFGEMIKTAGVQQYVPVVPGQYNSLIFTLTDQYGNELVLTDPSISCLFSIQSSSSGGGGGGGGGGATVQEITGLVYPRW